MLKIGLVSPFLPEKDGIAIYSNNILRGLGKKRKHITTIGRKVGKSDYFVDFKSFSLKSQLERIIKRENLNILHIQYVPTFFGKYNLNCGFIRALDLSIPVIVTLHEVQYSKKGMRNKLLTCIENTIIKRADKIIVHTPKQKEFLEKRCKTKKITLIYHGLRLNKITKPKKNKNVLCFGMISYGKGVSYLIRAMTYLPDYTLTIAGKFVDKRTEQKIKEELRMSRGRIKTEFKWINEGEKERYYRETDIVVLPHIWAPYQSGVLHNAVSYGIPVVVTRTGALWEIVNEFKFGEIVKPKNPRELAEGIKKVFKNYNTYKKGIMKYRASANWKKISQQHMNLYRSLANT